MEQVLVKNACRKTACIFIELIEKMRREGKPSRRILCIGKERFQLVDRRMYFQVSSDFCSESTRFGK